MSNKCMLEVMRHEAYSRPNGYRARCPRCLRPSPLETGWSCSTTADEGLVNICRYLCRPCQGHMFKLLSAWDTIAGKWVPVQYVEVVGE